MAEIVASIFFADIEPVDGRSVHPCDSGPHERAVHQKSTVQPSQHRGARQHAVGCPAEDHVTSRSDIVRSVRRDVASQAQVLAFS